MEPAREPAPTPGPLLVNCIVKDRDGAPIEGARIVVDFDWPMLGADGLPASATMVDAARAAFREGRTDAEGRASLEPGLPSGSAFSLVASAPGFLPRRRGVLAIGKNLERPSSFVLDRAGVLEGRVVDQEGAPVAGARVEARTSADPDLTASARSGPDGRFRIEGAPAGECRVRALPPSAAPGRAWAAESGAVPAEPGALDLEIVLKWVEVSGSTVRIEVVDATGAPVTVKQASLLPLDAWFHEIPRLTPSKPRVAAGGVTLDAVRAGRWRVWVETADHGVRYVDFEVLPGAAPVDSRLEVRSYGRLRGKVRAEVLAAPPRNGWQVGLELHGNGYFPQWVFTDPEKPGSLGRRGYPTPMAFADAEGSFRFANLLPGRYRVTLHADGVSAVADVDIRAGEESTVELAATRSAKVTFRLARPAWGRAYSISCWEEGGIRKPGRVEEAKGDGPVEVVREMPPGRIHWIVEWSDSPNPPDRGTMRRAGEGTVEIEPGASATVEVAAPPEAQPQTPR